MAFVYNPTNKQILVTEDPTAYLEQGYREPTLEELEQAKRVEDYGSFSQQAQAQAERVLRGATFGAVDGFGSEEENRARAEVSEELSPVISAAASIAPDVGVAALTGGLGGLATGAGRAAGRAALAEGAGIVRAGLAAGRAGGAAALAAESVGTGLVGAGQQAYAEGRELGDDPGADAENALIWGGLNFGLGAAMFGAARRGARSAERAAADATGETVEEVAEVAEARALRDLEVKAADEAAPMAGVDPAAAPPAVRAPLDDVRLPDQEGMLDDVIPPDDPRLAALQPELDKLRTDGIAGLSLNDLRALPIDEGPGAAQSAAKVDAFAADETFAREGMLPSNNDRGRGGLPALSLFPGEPPALSNGRHRLTAARKSGLEEMVMNVKAYDADGNTLWDYVGPVRVNEPRGIGAAAVRAGERDAVELGVERALRNASESEADELVEEALRQAPSSAKAGSKKGAAPKPVEAPLPEASSFGRQRRLYINRDAIADVAEREMATDLGGLMKDMDEVTRAEKLSTISSNVIENLPAQRAVAKGVAEDAAKLVGELRAEARVYAKASGKKGLQYAIDGQQQLSLDLLEHAEQISKAANGKGMFEALDALKRTAQEHKLALEEGMINATNSIHHQKLIPRIDQFAQRVRIALEDAGTWGKAGQMQRDYNAIISDQLLPHMKVFERSVLERTSKGYDGIWKTEGWETKIRNLLKGNDPGKARHVNAVLDAMDQLASVRRKYGDAAVADRIEARTGKVRRTMGLAAEVGDATERMQALGTMLGSVPMGGAIAGGLAGGLPGAAIGAALPGAVRGFVMGDLISAFQRLSGATEAAAARGVDDWVRSSRMRGQGLKVPRMPPLTEAGRQLRDVAARRGVTQGMALFMGDDESPHAAFVRWREALLDQPGFFKGLSDDYGSLQNEAPDVFMAVGGRADLARRFLVERMPPNTGVSMANPDGYLPSRDSIEDWALYVNAVRFPMRVLKNIGGAYMQEIETLRTVHPRVHEMAQHQVLRAMAKANTAGEALDDTFYARAQLLFPEVDGLGSPIFSRDFGRFVAEYNVEQKELQMQKAGGGRPGKPRQPPMSPTQHTIQSGATYGSGLA
jgi:hypothetical protein